MSVAFINKVHYEARITKAKSCVNVCNSGDLTLMGKVTIIKIVNLFSTCVFRKRDRVKREVIKRKKAEGLFDFSDYLTSMKMTIIKKILNPEMNHSWKSIFVKQFKFPGQIEISV